MRKYIALLLLFVCSATARAQVTGPRPTSTARDSVRTPVFVPSTGSRMLPPSILQELRRTQTRRTLVYHDTLRGSDIKRQHLNDSVDREYSDSALVILDTAVSLSHKDWLDSQLVEIPELSRFGERAHYNYPPSIIVETDVNPVPFDTSLLAGMNPISRENLPFFDQSPIPNPLPSTRPLEAFVEGGAGNVYQPLLGGWATYTFSPRTSGSVRAEYGKFSGVPLQSHFEGSISFDAQLGQDPGYEAYQSCALNARLSQSRRLINIFQDTSATQTTSTAHAVSLFTPRISVIGDASDQLHYDILLADHEFKDDLRAGISESGQQVRALVHYDPYIQHFRIIGEAGYERASMTIDSAALIAASGSGLQQTHPINGQYVKALFGRRKGEAFEWYGGVVLMGGSLNNGTSKESYSAIFPIGRIRVPLNPRWEIGASFEPGMTIASAASLAQANPFYSPYASAKAAIADSANFGRYDMRSVVMDRFNFAGFMNYMLSPVDEIRLDAQLVMRQREPVFEQHMLADSESVFTAIPKDTRRFLLNFSGSFLIATRDIITANVQFSSATLEDENREIPFEPSTIISAIYHFNSFSDRVQPALEYRSVARKDRTINLLNAEARIGIIPQLSLLIRAENILGSPSDFWPGYTEYPRSIWGTVRYTF